MSLSLALQNALTGLNVSQKSLSVLSNNIANANTDGYSRKIVSQEAVYIENQPSGVRSNGVLRKVDEYLLRAARVYGSQAERSATISDYYDKVQILLGKPGSDNSINAFIDSFFNSIRDLADNPESSSIRQTAVNAAYNMATELSSLASGLEDLRFEADQDLVRTISQTNDLITKLHKVNVALGQTYVGNSSIPDAGLLDERDVLLRDISKVMDIKVYYQPNGAAYVYTGPGVPLVDIDRYQLRYTPVNSSAAFALNANLSEIRSIPVDTNGAFVGTGQVIATAGSESEITTVLTAGKMKALLDMRDAELPAILAQLDELAASLRDEFNKVHNDGVGFPPPQSLTGTREVTATDYKDWSGSVRFAVVSSTGEPIANPFTNESGGIRPLTLDLGNLDVGNGEGRIDVQTFIDEFNAHFGTVTKKNRIGNLNDAKLVALTENNPAGLTQTFDFDFENISGGDADIVITGITPSSGAITSPATFPMNYTLEAGIKKRTGAGFAFDVAFAAAGTHTIDVDYQVTDADGVVSTATVRYTVDTTAINVKNDRYVGNMQTVPAPTGNSMTSTPTNYLSYARASLVDEDGSPVATGSSGFLKITVEDENYGIGIDEMTSREDGVLTDNPPVLGSLRGFSHYFELNNFFVKNDFVDINKVGTVGYVEQLENAAINFAVRSDILANPNLFAAGELNATKQPADTSLQPIYTYEVTSGNNVVASRLAALSRTTVSFDAAGSLPSTKKPFTDYASDILGSVASKTSLAESNARNDKFLYEGFQNRADAISGVNIDEELGNTIIFQNAYTASARVITVTKELFDVLLNTVG